MTDRATQMKYEEASDSEAAAERLLTLQRDAAAGDVNLPRAQKYISRAYADVRRSLEDTLAVQTRGVGGKFKGWLRKIPLDVAAVIALREVISTCMTLSGGKQGNTTSTQALCENVGRLYELEVRIAESEVVNPLYMKKVHEQVKENSTTAHNHLRRLYSTAYANIMKDGAESMMTKAENMQLGKFGVQACMDAGVISIERGKSATGSMVTYVLAPDVVEFLSDYSSTDVQLVLNRTAGYMQCPPDHWTNLGDGGYVSPRRKMAQPLMSMASVRKSERKRIRAEFTLEKMPKVFQCANYLQAVPFHLHQPVVSRVTELWEQGGGSMGIPTKLSPVKPPMPFPETWVKADATEEELAAFHAWIITARAYYTSLKDWRSKVREVGAFFKSMADNPDRIWFPVFMDKRGRWYYRGYPNPQGSDIAKASIHLANKKALGVRGLYWLKVHIANCYGYDKTRFDDRAAWTDTNWGIIQAGLSAPQDSDAFQKADSPWCMYSAAYELNEAYKSGDPLAYKTGVLVQMDATCSGLQHFSAMLRDPVGGSYVNLHDAGGPAKQDIYAKVALNAVASIELDTEDADPIKAKIALWWKRAGISRGMAKGPVMTYCYGATLRSTVSGVYDYVRNELGLKFPEGERDYDYTSYAAKKLFTGIESTVPAAASVMQWLRSVAKQMPCGKRMEWTTPTGFKVQHDYQDFDEIRVNIASCGVTKILVHNYNEDTKVLTMQSAISPNFVHALDASHLTLTALSMAGKGLDMAGIHDSFGTCPCDVDEMHKSIRESFVGMYAGDNVLNNFLWEVQGIGEVPMRGTLDLAAVLDSEFFFC